MPNIHSGHSNKLGIQQINNNKNQKKKKKLIDQLYNFNTMENSFLFLHREVQCTYSRMLQSGKPCLTHQPKNQQNSYIFVPNLEQAQLQLKIEAEILSLGRLYLPTMTRQTLSLPTAISIFIHYCYHILHVYLCEHVSIKLYFI